MKPSLSVLATLLAIWNISGTSDALANEPSGWESLKLTIEKNAGYELDLQAMENGEVYFYGDLIRDEKKVEVLLQDFGVLDLNGFFGANATDKSSLNLEVSRVAFLLDEPVACFNEERAFDLPLKQRITQKVVISALPAAKPGTADFRMASQSAVVPSMDVEVSYFSSTHGGEDFKKWQRVALALSPKLPPAEAIELQKAKNIQMLDFKATKVSAVTEVTTLTSYHRIKQGETVVVNITLSAVPKHGIFDMMISSGMKSGSKDVTKYLVAGLREEAKKQAASGQTCR